MDRGTATGVVEVAYVAPPDDAVDPFAGMLAPDDFEQAMWHAGLWGVDPFDDAPPSGSRATISRIDRLLDDHDAGMDRLDTPEEQLATVLAWRRLAARVEARLEAQLETVRCSDAASIAHGVPTRTWLAQTERITAREAGRLLARSAESARFGRVAAALAEGTIGVEQAAAVVDTLKHLPGEFSGSQIAAAQVSLLGYATEFDTAGLKRLANHIVEVIAPELVDERLHERLERERQAAHAHRGLSFTRDDHGSVHLKGRLPLLEAEELMALIDAHVKADRSRYAADPLAEVPSAAALRADALMEIVRTHQSERAAPTHGGDRPRVVVTLGWQDLVSRLGDGTLASGDGVSATEVRRIACDADLLPVVLGGRGQVLDVGAEQRLATAAIRSALAVRDRGCVMPGCDHPPAACEAHHVVPWQQGGPTTLANLVLLCRTHHRIVEPDPRRRAGSQWEVRFDEHRIPWVLPPSHVDPARRPLRHHRFDRPRSTGGVGIADDEPP